MSMRFTATMPPPQGGKFAIRAVTDRGQTVGVAICGRPVAREEDDGVTMEVTRLATDGTPNACSLLYAAARRVGQAMGYERFLTYIEDDETGVSLSACGWKQTRTVAARSWSRPKRSRTDKHEIKGRRRFEPV